eukprot:CAMPEP_0202108258 /NCGR_PEP_ID=MMETSP0965-20130614/20034_1 /ASSEMBLY_ACC=CAM_ASM_000507 /TAXON_ID=4773 /ORGANISM="Schizochytrium aggregatum, Strain ATCC28209" /LENGTH=201 /DNA_ID=CAMNT_0048677493 /DNA_START=11 /DNA_END=616 /DNA_ORIENTATION=-
MAWPVVLYIANIIDYFRAIFLYVAWKHYEAGDQWKFVGFYVLSYVLDAFDGMVARAMGQTSKLGLYLDMIIDRISSALCLHIAATQVLKDYPEDVARPIAIGLWSALIVVEVLSHGVVMYKSEVGGFHQKEMESTSPIVRSYLDKKAVLFWSCASFEGFSLGLVLSQPAWALPFLPGFLFRSLANTLRLRDVIFVRARKVD